MNDVQFGLKSQLLRHILREIGVKNVHILVHWVPEVSRRTGGWETR